MSPEGIYIVMVIFIQIIHWIFICKKAWFILLLFLVPISINSEWTDLARNPIKGIDTILHSFSSSGLRPSHVQTTVPVRSPSMRDFEHGKITSWKCKWRKLDCARGVMLNSSYFEIGEPCSNFCRVWYIHSHANKLWNVINLQKVLTLWNYVLTLNT